MSLLRKLAVVITGMAMMTSLAFAENEGANLEYPIVAAYVYNFTQFTVWPSGVRPDRFNLCVLGRNPFGELLEPLKKKTARGINFTLTYIASPNTHTTDCDVLFIADSQREGMKRIIGALGNAPVLTISNIEGFADAGGMVELYKEDTKIAIRINNQAVRNAGLAISSKLLSLAHIVNGSGE